jgi:hypothetical protein
MLLTDTYFNTILKDIIMGPRGQSAKTLGP